MAMVLRITFDGTVLMAILGLMGREDLQIRFASGIRSLIFRVNWTGVSASVGASVECEHEHGVLIDSLLDLHEHGGDTVGPTIVSNTTAQGLAIELRH